MTSRPSRSTPASIGRERPPLPYSRLEQSGSRRHPPYPATHNTFKLSSQVAGRSRLEATVFDARTRPPRWRCASREAVSSSPLLSAVSALLFLLGRARLRAATSGSQSSLVGLPELRRADRATLPLLSALGRTVYLLLVTRGRAMMSHRPRLRQARVSSLSRRLPGSRASLLFVCPSASAAGLKYSRNNQDWQRSRSAKSTLLHASARFTIVSACSRLFTSDTRRINK